MIIDQSLGRNTPAQSAQVRRPTKRTQLIGVIAKTEEAPFVEEFFELFKTPWEYFDPEKSYDVVISTGNAPHDFDGRLLAVFCSTPTRWDSENGVVFNQRLRNCFAEVGNEKLPIYGEVATFHHAGSRIANVVGDPESAGAEISLGGTKVIRLGYDLFAEVAFLLSQGQPPQNALFPTLDLHISILRRFIIEAGIPLIEIPPAPAGARFISCLTHDIDFLYLRQHKFDRTMWGFLYRATVGTMVDFVEGRIPLRKLVTNWSAALKLPLVHAGLCRDFWLPFDRYLEIENGKPSTFFLIPFRNRAGKSPDGLNARRRATKYDVDDIHEWINVLRSRGCEIAVHGIDAWNDPAKAKEELGRIVSLTGETEAGLRTHWLYCSSQSPRILEKAGFSYDSTCGFNEAVGYRAGTSQVFKPVQVTDLLELPLHIQDTALFFPGRMHLSEPEAWELCLRVLGNCHRHGGVITLLWHDRSLAPERLWGAFYAALLGELESAATWFGTAKETVGWFRKRRSVRFKEVRQTEGRFEVLLDKVPGKASPDLALRLSYASGAGEASQVEAPLDGRDRLTLEMPAGIKPEQSFMAGNPDRN